MTSFTFFHAADLHLGSPLAGLAVRDAEIARRFAAAGRGAFEDLVTRAIERRVALLVIAGDIYDGDWPDATIGLFFARQVARLAREGIRVAYVRGNHDAESVVTRTIGLPEGVLDFPSDRAATHRLDDLRVALHGRSFPDRAVTENLSETYPEGVPGWFNIGLLHTSCAGHPAHETYAPCTPAGLAARGYEYWALGHVHDYAQLHSDPPIVFPGNLQGRSVRETGPKGAVEVEVRDGRVAALRRIIVDRARWAQVAVDLDAVETEAGAIAAVTEALRAVVDEAGGRLVAVRVRLQGRTRLHESLLGERERFAAEVQAAGQRLHEDVWLERLVVQTEPLARPAPIPGGGLDPAAFLHGLAGDPEFRARAERLVAEMAARLPVCRDEPGLAAELDAIIAEAEALIGARLPPSPC